MSPPGLKSGHTRVIDLRNAHVRAAHMSYVCGLRLDLYVPVDLARHVDLALRRPGADPGLKDAGHAIDALRIEAGRRA